jgi:hypothetical protein
MWEVLAMFKIAKLCLIVIIVGLSASANADTATLYPTDDASVSQDNPDANFGSSNTVYVGYSGAWVNTLIKFDLSSYTGATINGAYIRLYVYGHYGDFPTDMVRITMNDADWSEGTVTWNNKPGFNGQINLTAPGTYGWWEVYVTNWVQDMVDGTEPNYGFQIYQNDTDYALFLMYTKENSTNRPTLEINYTPSAVESSSLGELKAAFR